MGSALAVGPWVPTIAARIKGELTATSFQFKRRIEFASLPPKRFHEGSLHPGFHARRAISRFCPGPQPWPRKSDFIFSGRSVLTYEKLTTNLRIRYERAYEKSQAEREMR
jgi:hypothetical protein